MQLDPVQRTFRRFRAICVRELGIDRAAVRPDTKLSQLVPREHRRQLWKALRRHGLEPPGLSPGRAGCLICLLPPLAAMGLACWFEQPLWLLLVLPLALGGYWLSAPDWVELTDCVDTVEELAIYMTPFQAAKVQGFPWTTKQIQTKVRMAIAESVGRPLQSVRLTTSWAELENL